MATANNEEKLSFKIFIPSEQDPNIDKNEGSDSEIENKYDISTPNFNFNEEENTERYLKQNTQKHYWTKEEVIFM